MNPWDILRDRQRDRVCVPVDFGIGAASGAGNIEPRNSVLADEPGQAFRGPLYRNFVSVNEPIWMPVCDISVRAKLHGPSTERRSINS